PWRERRGRPALTAAPPQLALLVHELIERNFPQAALADLLSSPLVELCKRANLARHRVARRLREARVRDDSLDQGSGRGGVVQRLQALAARLQHAGEDREAAETLAVARLAARAIDEVRALPERAPLAEHGRALLALLRSWGVGEAAG